MPHFTPLDSTIANTVDSSSGLRRKFTRPDFPPGQWGCIMPCPLEALPQRRVSHRTPLSTATNPCSFKPPHYHVTPGPGCNFAIDEYDDGKNERAATNAPPSAAEHGANLAEGTHDRFLAPS